MSRYIDTNLISYEHHDRLGLGVDYGTTDRSTYEIAYKSQIDKIPTADVEEVRHGYWKMCFYPNDEHVECSECHAQYYEYDLYLGGNEFPKRCPECGAHMDVKENEE